MLLTESEGKALLVRAGLAVPKSMLIFSHDELNKIDLQQLIYPVFVKAQVLHGNRELQNLIRRASSFDELNTIVGEMFAQTDQFDQPISGLLIEQSVNFSQQVYLSLTYETKSRSLVAQYSHQGGVGMDDRGNSIQTVELSSLEEPNSFFPDQRLLSVVQKVWHVVFDNDATLVEINPLVITDTDIYCLDAKIELDDAARFRHEEWQLYGERSSMGRPPTQLELRAKEVSSRDHRGVAGESFFEFIGGQIGVMASGGGASLLAMDALMAEGISPANYTEYSGNPSREKVRSLTDVVLSIKNLEGLYVVGSNASFTDIYETLAGVIDGLLESDYVDQDNFSLLIRRGGPRWQEAFEMVRERLSGKPLKYKLFGPDFPIVATAREMKQMLEENKK